MTLNFLLNVPLKNFKYLFLIICMIFSLNSFFFQYFVFRSMRPRFSFMILIIYLAKLEIPLTAVLRIELQYSRCRLQYFLWIPMIVVLLCCFFSYCSMLTPPPAPLPDKHPGMHRSSRKLSPQLVCFMHTQL